MNDQRRAGVALAAVVVVALVAPAPALAAGWHVPLVSGDFLGIGGLVSGVFSSVGHAVLGAFSWTIGLASKFILVTIGALVRMLIPRSWAHAGLQIMRWIVAVPDYAGQVTTPTGHHVYGFAGINTLRDVFTWLGVAIAPLSLIYATSRAMVGDGDPVAIPVLRIAAATVAVLSYPYWWSQAAAVCDQITNVILSVPAVSAGLYRLMDYAVAGVALGGWQLIDLGLMGATALALLALIFLKVVVILLGALLYATGPVTIGLVPTRAGAALARAWASAAGMLLGLGIAWATIFAVGALLIGDSSTAGPLIAGNTTFGSLVGGLLLAVAGVASLWICLKVAREAAGILRFQLAGLLMFGGATGSAASRGAGVSAGTTGASLRAYGQRLAAAASAAGGELAVAGPGGTRLAGAAQAAGYVGRRGLLGTAAAGARLGAHSAAPAAGRVMQRSRAGAVAAAMARAGTASWHMTPPAGAAPGATTRTASKAAPRAEQHGRRDRPRHAPGPIAADATPTAAPSNPAPRPRMPVGAAASAPVDGRRGDRAERTPAPDAIPTDSAAAPAEPGAQRPAPSTPPRPAASPPPTAPSTAHAPKRAKTSPPASAERPGREPDGKRQR